MYGSFELTNNKIDQEVTKTSAGNYALGHNEKNTFIVKYVGRSDDDLNKRLKDWVGDFERFKYSYATSPKAAFEKECRNYHDFGENKNLNNEYHPDRPDESTWKCPVCDVFDD